MTCTRSTFFRIAMVSAFLLGACEASLSDQARFRTDAEAYIRTNIADLSPRSPELGGRFTVTKVEWVDDDTARIFYEDGHISLRGTADVRRDEDEDDVFILTRFQVENNSPSSAGTTSNMSAGTSSMSLGSTASTGNSSVRTTSSAGAAASVGANVSAAMSAGITY